MTRAAARARANIASGARKAGRAQARPPSRIANAVSRAVARAPPLRARLAAPSGSARAEALHALSVRSAAIDAAAAQLAGLAVITRRAEARTVLTADAVDLATGRAADLITSGTAPSGRAAALVATAAKFGAAGAVDALGRARCELAAVSRPSAVTEALASERIALAVTAAVWAALNLTRVARPARPAEALAIVATDATRRDLSRRLCRRRAAIRCAGTCLAVAAAKALEARAEAAMHRVGTAVALARAVAAARACRLAARRVTAPSGEALRMVACRIINRRVETADASTAAIGNRAG